MEPHCKPCVNSAKNSGSGEELDATDEEYSRRRLRHRHFCRSGAWRVGSPYASVRVRNPCRNAFLVRVVRTLCHARLASGRWDGACYSRKLGPGRRLSELDASGGLQPLDVAALPGVTAEVMCSRLEVADVGGGGRRGGQRGRRRRRGRR